MDQTQNDTHIPPGQPPRPTLRFDWQDWLPYFEADDVPEAQKRVLIETLWSIVVAFVDLGWQVFPTAGDPATGACADGPTSGRAGPGAKQSCGQAFDLKAALEAAVLKSEIIETCTAASGDSDSGTKNVGKGKPAGDGRKGQT